MHPLREEVPHERPQGGPQGRTWRLDRFLCILCGECVDSCNKAALRLDKHYFAPVTTPAEGVELHNVPAPPAAPAASAAPAAPSV